MNKQNRNEAALLGHCVDIWDFLMFRYKNPHSWTKFRQIKAVAKLSGATRMLETGTYRGVTTRRCAKYFEKIWKIGRAHV